MLGTVEPARGFPSTSTMPFATDHPAVLDRLDDLLLQDWGPAVTMDLSMLGGFFTAAITSQKGISHRPAPRSGPGAGCCVGAVLKRQIAGKNNALLYLTYPH